LTRRKLFTANRRSEARIAADEATVKVERTEDLKEREGERGEERRGKGRATNWQHLPQLPSLTLNVFQSAKCSIKIVKLISKLTAAAR